MDIIILGLLMIKNCTIYEMRKTIETVFTSISSNSMGSIQASIKKLLHKKMIIFDEFVENSVNKKVYCITDIGKSYFFSEIQIPMKHKEKNMELNKLFFMGFVPKDKRIELIEAYITELLEERKWLEQIQTTVQETNTMEDHLDNINIQKIVTAKDSKDLLLQLQDIAQFQYATLSLSIEKVDFEIQWFEQFKKKLQQR